MANVVRNVAKSDPFQQEYYAQQILGGVSQSTIQLLRAALCPGLHSFEILCWLIRSKSPAQRHRDVL